MALHCNICLVRVRRNNLIPKVMITAKEAFETASKKTETVQKILNNISIKISTAANNGQYSIDYDFKWFCPSDVREEVIKGLGRAGYSLGFTYGPDLRIFWEQDQPSSFETAIS